jgi:two-component system chemotaxis sensor kinase CheA
MEDLINEFIAETREMLEALGGEIVAWESAPNDRARLDEIFRFVHTVKGNCGFFDLPRLETLSHAAEGALAEVRSGARTADHRLVSAVLAIIDRIGELVQALETGESVSSADDAQLIEALTASPSASGPEQQASAGTVLEGRKVIRSIRLSIDLLDRMMSGVSDMVLARNELSRRLREAPTDLAVEAAFERVSCCIAEMRDAITRTRMQRIDNLFVTLPRMVRDLSSELGKQVGLEVDGGDVELDREMIEMIRDPLTHIVRNALDHGIEPASDRVAAGKAPGGMLRVCARQSGNQILIDISDDGRGIDGEKLVRKAVSNNVLSEQQAERLSAAQKTALIFEAGLSTASEVTSISGRGVGMDVVRANVERIGGVVDVDSKLGQGVRFTLRVPLTLTIIPALTVSSGGQTFAIPRSAIEEIVRSKNDSVQVEALGGSHVASIRGKRIPLTWLADVLGVAPEASASEQSFIVLKPAGGDLYALGVDLVHDHEELVIKPAAPVVMATGLYAGTTLADDGSPILLLDPSGIAARAGLLLDQNELEKLAAKPHSPEASQQGTQALLFRTIQGAKRVIPLAVVERIEDVLPDAIKLSAGRLRVAIGDEILPLAGCGDQVPDRRIRILRLSDGNAELAYGFVDVADLVLLSGEMKPASSAGEVSGVTLIAGEQVEIVDTYWLFADCASAHEGGGAKPVCALPTDDPWMNTILRPIIEGAGYQVVSHSDAEAADILITNAEDVDVPPISSGQVVRIRSSAEVRGKGDDSIYRYDRAGLISALSRHAAKRSKG